jgi:hypothetical protein
MSLPRHTIGFLALCAITLPASSALAQKFDGRWNVVLTTDVGKCEPAIAAAFAVKKDDISADEESSLKADGAVEPNGTMWVRFSAGQDQYRAQGKLTPGSGSGVWSSGSRYCGGKWRATRTR